MVKLTVAIPSYNRINILFNSLSFLLPQLTQECELLIIDNHSEPSVGDGLELLLTNFKGLTYNYIYNSVNIGSGANILRCFELCKTKWIWLLGDDDIVTPDSIKTIFTTIQENPDVLFFNFASHNFRRHNSFTTIGQYDFVNRLESWGHTNFMSVSVFNSTILRDYIKFGYFHTFSMSPQIAMLLASMSDNTKCYFSNLPIIGDQSLAEDKWATVLPALGKYTLLNLIKDHKTRKILSRKLAYRPSLEEIALLLHISAQNPLRKKMAIYQYDQYCLNAFYYDHSFKRRFQIWLFGLLVKHPFLTKSIINAFFPLIKLLYGKNNISRKDIQWVDLYQRM